MDQLRENKIQSDKNIVDPKSLIANMNTMNESRDARNWVKTDVFTGKNKDFYDWQSNLQDAAAKNRKLFFVLQWAKEEREAITMETATAKSKVQGIEGPENELDKLFCFYVDRP